MTQAKALIFSIETYGRSGDLAQKLLGTTPATAEFLSWANGFRAIPADDIWVCSDSSLLPGSHHFGTTRQGIREALQSLCKAARDVTRELFVFISGHGFSYTTDPEFAAADMLVTSNYT